jgi:hypothetical protein
VRIGAIDRVYSGWECDRDWEIFGVWRSQLGSRCRAIVTRQLTDCKPDEGEERSLGVGDRASAIIDDIVQRELMNQLSSSRLRVTLRLEAQASGRVAASVIEFPDCRVEAATREAAIAEVQAAFLEQLARSETISWDVPLPFNEDLNGSGPKADSPWIKYAGMFKDDLDFAEIAAEIRAEREIEDDTEVDPSVYSLEGRL